MKQEPSRVQKMLENIQPPQVEIPLHQRRLKTDLLKMHEQMRKNPVLPFILNFNNFMKKFLPLSVSAVALLAIVVVLNNTGMFSSATASAKELVEQAIGKVKAQVEKSDASAGTQLQSELSALEKAKDAKDLAYLGEEDAGEKGKVKKLSYTDESGKKVTITFDENDSEDPVDVEEENGEHEDEKVTGSSQESESSESQEREVKAETESKDQSETEVKGAGESGSEGLELNKSEKSEVSEVSQDKTTESETKESPETSVESDISG